MNKLFARIASITAGLALVVGAGVALASHAEAKGVSAEDSLSYTLDFKANESDTDSSAALGTTVADYFVDGADYVASLTSSKVYLGKSSMNGIKFGSSSAKGTLTLTLSSSGQVKATKITLALALYDASKKVNVSINGATSGTGYSQLSPTTSLADYDVAWDGSTNLSTITVEANVASKCRFYLDYIKVYVDGGAPVCTHVWDDGTVHAPTCTEAGYTEYECTLCGATKQEDIVPALGHSWVAGEVHAPTCTEAGYTEFECSTCHETKNDDYIDATGHNFVNHICTVCGAEEPTEVTFAYPSGTTTNMTGENDAATLGQSASDWSVVGYKGGNTNLPGLNTAGEIRIYGSNQNYIVVKTLVEGRNLTSVSIASSQNHFAVYEGEADFASAISSSTQSSPYVYALGTGVTAFTIRNASSTQSKIQGITVSYTDGSTPTPVTSYTVTNAVQNGSLNKNSVNKGETLTATITPNAGYNVPESVSVTMGGVDTTCDYSNGVVTVANVTGDIVITGSCVSKYAHAGTESDPFTVAEALDKAAEIGTVGNTGQGPWVTTGIISRVTSVPTASFWNATYYISDDGSQNNELQVYRGFYLDNAKFDATTALLMKAGMVVTVTGNLTGSYGGEYCSGNYLLSIEEPSTGEITVTFEPNTSLEIGDVAEFLASTPATNPHFTWSVEDPNILSVDETTGEYEALALGVTKVTVSVTSDDGNGEASAYITVNAAGVISVPEAYDIAATLDGSKDETTQYYVYVQGYVSQFDSDGKTRAFTITDLDETQSIMVFVGASPYPSFIDGLALGDYIVVKANVQNYGGTYELKDPVKVSSNYSAFSLAFEILNSTKETCDSYVDGESDYNEFKKTFETLWSTLSGKYTSLTDKEVLERDAKPDGTTVEQALYRYDFLTAKYQLDGFITGHDSAFRIMPTYETSTVDSNVAIMVVTIVAITSISAIGVILVIKRRKAIR